MARNKRPPREPAPTSKPEQSSKLTAAELAAALRGETTLPADKIEQAIAGVQVDSAAVEQTLKRRIDPDGTVSGSPTGLRVFDALDAGALKPANMTRVEWSDYDSPKRWAKRIGLSWKSIKRRIDQGTLVADFDGTKWVRFRRDCLPENCR